MKAQKPAGRSTLILLDTHAILHRAYHALPDFASAKGEPTGALYGLSLMLISIANELKPDYIVAAYDLPGPTYRHEAYKAYKAGRAKTDPALSAQIQRSQDLIRAFNIPIYSAPGFEADDILGTIVEKIKDQRSKIKDEGVDVIIASGDMDTMQLIDDARVRVYTLKKGIKDTVLYDEKGILARFGFGPKLIPDYKGLRGDASDNIVGIEGIGEKTATDLIQNFGGVEDIYAVLEEGKKGEKKLLDAGIKARIIELLKNGKEEAEFSKMLATIRRDAPIDFELPAKKWREGFDFEKLEAMFKELEFRTLGARVKAVIEGKAAGGKSQAATEEVKEKAKSKKQKKTEEPGSDPEKRSPPAPRPFHSAFRRMSLGKSPSAPGSLTPPIPIRATTTSCG